MAAPNNVYSTSTWEDQYGCFNQLINHGNFDATSGWTTYTSNAPYAIDSEGVCTITVNTAVRNPMVTRTFTSVAANHKVFVSLWLKISSSTNVPFRPAFIYTPTTYLTSAQQSSNYADWTHITGIIDTGSAAKTRIYVGAIGVASTNTFPVGAKIYLKNVWMTDLTAMYGSGNEPTAALFESRYPKNYYAYKEAGGTTNTQIYCKLPLQKEEYTNDNTFKTTFYCDHVLPVVDAAGHNCVLGLVTPNSDNYNHHGSDRIGKLMMRWHSTDYNILNDGGLNTTPHIILNSTVVSTSCPMQYANHIMAKANLKGAYYVDNNQFRAEVYKVSGGVESYIHGAYFMPTAEQIDYPAQFSQNNVSAIIKDFVGISQGDTVRVKTVATNSEGSYLGTRVAEFTALAPVNFTQVYRFTSAPTSSTNPLTGTKYLMAIDQSRYSTSGNGGTFTRLFALPSGDWLDLGAESGGEWLRGCVGEPGVEDTTAIANLAQGYYYGVPTTWQGDTFRYVQIANGTSGTSTRRLAWFANNYSTNNFTLTMSMSGVHHRLDGSYTITVTATLSGTWGGNVSVTCPIYTNARTPALVTTLNGSGGSSSFTVGSFTYTGTDDLRTGNGGRVPTTSSPAATSITEGSIALRSIPWDDQI